MKEKEAFKSGLNRTAEILSNVISCAKYDSQMGETLEDFKKEMIRWMECDSSSTENPVSKASQELWYSLYLEKKRLENHNLNVEYAAYEHKSQDSISSPITTCTYYRDGKYLICKASQFTYIEKNYLRQGDHIGHEKQNRNISYYIICSKNENELYICPNCGAEQSLEQLLDGCDYCETKFDISTYKDKVLSVIKRNDILDSREMNAKTSIAWSVLIVIGIACVISVILIPCALVFLPVGIIGYCKSVKKAFNSLPVKQALLEQNPDFSEEEFIGSLDCKLKAIHYATNMNEIKAFVKCDISSYVSDYQNIVNCEIGKISYKNYRVDGDYQYLDVCREVEVMQDEGDYLKPAKGIIALTLAKKRSYKLKNDITLFRCGSCGASISLVEGGKCKYCGNEMNYALYDWIVTEYKHVNEL